MSGRRVQPIDKKIISNADLTQVAATEILSDFIDLLGLQEFCLHFKSTETGTTTTGSVDLFIQKYTRDHSGTPITIGPEQDIVTSTSVITDADGFVRWGSVAAIAEVGLGTASAAMDEFQCIGMCKIGIRIGTAANGDTCVGDVWLQAR